MLLILTNSADYHTDIILKTINENNLGVYFRLNTDLFHTDYEIEIYPTEKKFILINKKNGKIAHSESITCAWWRRPEKINVKQGDIPEKLQDYLIDEYRIVLRTLVHLLNQSDVKIVTYPPQLNKAKDKSLQQIWAQEVGFQTPKQIITSSNSAFKKHFINNDSIISKSIDSIATIGDSENDYVLYANLLTCAQRTLIENNLININVSYFQEKITRKHELRVIAFDTKSFIFKIESNDYLVDWRRIDPDSISFELIEDNFIHTRCIDYLQKSNLKFGAFDFIVDARNEVYFIECNPNGQFLFCDINLKTNMIKEFAEYLTI